MTANPTSSMQSNEQQQRAAAVQRAVQTRQRQALELQRELILSQRTSNAHRRAALAAALEQVEAQISALD